MTFILNLLHKDFSLIAGDKQGNAVKPGTLKVGATTIHHNGKLTVEGIRKVFLTGNKHVALGYAGNTGDHGYVQAFSRTDTGESAIRCVRQHMDSFFRFECRDSFLNSEPRMENSALISFFDDEKSAYWTALTSFTQFSSHTDLSARRQNPSPILIHIGSGSTHFEAAAGLDAINKFIEDVKIGASLEAQLEWFQEAFYKVSAVAPGCGTNFDAVLSTRESPEFRYVHGDAGQQITL